MKKLLLFLFGLWVSTTLNAQTTVTTGVPSSASALSGSNPAITFAIQNTNSYAIVISAMGFYQSSTVGAQTWTLYYTSTSLSGTANISAPAWTVAHTAAAPAVTTTAIHPLFTGMNFTIPANTTYRFAMSNTGTYINYGGSTTAPNIVTGGGVSILTGNYTISSSNVGYSGGMPNGTITPRFAGVSITFAPAGPPCNAPTGLTASGITYNSANTSWGAVTGATGYEYVVTTSSTPPASGTATTGTSYNATALTAGTTYYLHVRTQCAATTFSPWTTYSFSTPSCAAPTGLSSSNITYTSATFNWNAVTGASGYEYALTNNTTPPTSGTVITGTTFNAINLTDNTNYCLHVRAECAPGVYSSWSNTCIMTPVAPPCPMPDTLGVTNITMATADLSWNGLPAVTGYEYAVTQSAVPPSGGTATTATTYSATGLTFATQYYAHVRSTCTGNLFSAWNTKAFNTPYPPCDSPVATVSNITNEEADISWNVVPYAQSYQVAVFSNPNPPNISGVPTTATSYHVNNLVSGKLYYVHLRTVCAFDTSAWSTATFYSTIPASVSTVGGSATIAVYPNPVTDVLNIKLNSQPGHKAQIIMTDALGKELNRVVVSTKEFAIDMSNLPAGVYLLRYQDEEAINNIKVLKQ